MNKKGLTELFDFVILRFECTCIHIPMYIRKKIYVLLKNKVVSKSKGTMHVEKIFDSEIIF